MNYPINLLHDGFSPTRMACFENVDGSVTSPRREALGFVCAPWALLNENCNPRAAEGDYKRPQLPPATPGSLEHADISRTAA